jgi:hypothetical protein
MMTTTKITPAQQKVLDRLKAGGYLSIEHTKIGSTELYECGRFAGERRGVPAKTILSLVEKGLIKEASRKESYASKSTDIVVYQLNEVKS